MYKDVLQEKYGIPAAAMKTVPAPRIITSYCGPEKPSYVSTLYMMIANGIMPADGWKRSIQKELRQYELTAAVGLKSRSAFTGRISRLRGTAAKYVPCPTCQGSSAGECKVCKPKGRHKGKALAKRDEALDVPTMTAKRRGFSGTDIYTLILPEKSGVEWLIYRKSTGRPVPKERFTGADPQASNLEALARASELGIGDHEVRARYLKKDCFHYPSPREILANPVLKQVFDPELMFKKDGSFDFDGTFALPLWVWHPSAGLSCKARLVMTYYIACGLLSDKDKKTGKLKGYVRPKQTTAAHRTGLSEKTVRAGDRELERKGYIRKKGEVVNGPDGIRRTVSTILFMPIRTMTDEEILDERRRLFEARRALHESRKALRRQLRCRQMEEAQRHELGQQNFALAVQCCMAARVHRRVVEGYKGRTARIGAIWEAARTELLKARIGQKVISALIPCILAPPLAPPGDPPDQIAAIIDQSHQKAL